MKRFLDFNWVPRSAWLDRLMVEIDVTAVVDE
jgi:hypothetical protein